MANRKRTFNVTDEGKPVEEKEAPVATPTAAAPAETPAVGTRVFLRLTASGQAAANHAAQKLHVSFVALLINAGALFDRGEIASIGKSGDGKPLIEADSDLVNKLVAMAVAYRDSQPIGGEDAMKIATSFLIYVLGDGREWKGVRAMNSWMDLTPVDAAVSRIESLKKSCALDLQRKDFRELAEAAQAAKDEVEGYICSQQRASVARQIEQLDGDTKVAFEKELCHATDGNAVRALGARLVQAGIYDPARKPAERERENDRGGRGGRHPSDPETGRGFSRTKWEKRRQQGWRG